MNKSTVLKITLSLFGLAILLIISEIVYEANNKPQTLVSYPLVFSEWLIDKGKGEKSIRITQKSGELSLILKRLKYKQGIPKVNLKPADDEYKRFVDSYSEVMKKSDISAIIGQRNSDISRLFYDLSLTAHKNELKDFSTIFLIYAAYSNPGLSLYQVELANKYLLEGQKNEAEKVLNNCGVFETAKTHCEMYKTVNFNSNSPQDFGFLEEEINKHYKNL